MKMTAFTDSEYTYLQDEVLEVLNSMVVVDSDADSEGMNYVYVAAIPENIAVLARLVPNVDEYVQQYTEDGALCDYETDVIDIQWAAWDCGAKWFDGEKFLLHAPLDLEVIKERVERATEGSWEVMKSDDKGVQIGTTWAHPQLKAAVPVVTTAKSLKGVTTYIKDDDAEFIAHARQDVPALIAEVERLREENNQLRMENAVVNDTFKKHQPFFTTVLTKKMAYEQALINLWGDFRISRTAQDYIQDVLGATGEEIANGLTTETTIRRTLDGEQDE